MEKVGRNDPCPCGSGKKFKKCCEAKVNKKSIGNAQVLTGTSAMASLFQRHVTVQKPAEEAPPDAPKE